MFHSVKQRTFHFQSTGKLSCDVKDFVDSIEAIGNGKTIASKCVLHGCIYIWNLEDALKNQPRVIKPLHILKWSSTDNFYMNIGINASKYSQAVLSLFLAAFAYYQKILALIYC